MSKRIETKVSRTAQMVCLLRALSFYDDMPYHTDDYIAPIFIPFLFRMIIRNKFFRRGFKKKIPNPGMYEYIVARTGVIDELFQNLPPDIRQVLIFGAGLDSRVIRFRNDLRNIMVFELDSYVTQQTKKDKYKSKNIELPDNLKFIDIDFDNDSLAMKLNEGNFVKNEPSLFVLEGLTMFLNQESIDITFNIINEYAAPNSIIVFDYIYTSDLNGESVAGQDVTQTVDRIGEKYKFGIEKGKIKDFLDKYQFELMDEFDSDKLKEKFFNSEKDAIPPIGLYGIAVAKKD